MIYVLELIQIPAFANTRQATVCKSFCRNVRAACSCLLFAPCVLYTLLRACTFAHIKNVPFVRRVVRVCTSFMLQIIFFHLLFCTFVPQFLQPSFFFSFAYIHNFCFFCLVVCAVRRRLQLRYIPSSRALTQAV